MKKVCLRFCFIIGCFFFPFKEILSSKRFEKKRTLNIEQVLILKKAANDLNFKIQDLKIQSSKFLNVAIKEEALNSLRDSLFTSAKEVKKIQSAFSSASTNTRLCSFNRNYFNDILYRYDESQDSLISYRKTATNIDKTLNAVLSVLQYNYKAYSIVAEKEEPQFDLIISSIPYGAKIYYWKDGDEKPEEFNKGTIAEIKKLDYCRWHFSTHLDGYIDEKRDFDPYNEKGKVLDFGQLKQAK